MTLWSFVVDHGAARAVAAEGSGGAAPEAGGAPGRGRLRAAAPSLVTAAGHALSLLWLWTGFWPFGVIGLLADAVDGALARRLGAVSRAGALYDWLVDCTLAALLLHRLCAPLLLLLVPLQAVLYARGTRVSGRAALTLFVLLWNLGGR